MTRTGAFGAAALFVGWCAFPGLIIGAEENSAATFSSPERTVRSASGLLLGVVTDVSGSPLEETLVSATGPAGTSLAVCDAEGRFEIRGLAPGVYLLRTHVVGFTAGERHLVEVRSGRTTVRAVTLRRESEAALERVEPVAAGFGTRPAGRLLDLIGVELEAAQLDGDEEADDSEDEHVSPGRVAAPHDDSEKAWWLRRARRSILKDAGYGPLSEGSAAQGFARSPSPYSHRAVDVLPSSDLSSGFPLSGRFQLLTRANLDAPSDLSSDILPGQVAHVSLGGLAHQSRWGLQGAVTTGDAGSFVLGGTYVSEVSTAHTLVLGASYSRQHFRSSEDSGALRSSAGLDDTADLYARREVGSLSAEGAWEPGSRVAVDYGVNLARYGYLERGNLYSPRAEVTVTPFGRTRVRVGASQYMLAPGAEEFLPPVQGVWLPPERTFASVSEGEPLRAERARQVELAVERDVGRESTVAVRRFVQDVDDQIVTMFGVRPQALTLSSDHYYLARADGVSAEGWGLAFSTLLAGRVRSSVDYSVTEAQWAPWMVSGLSPLTVGVLRVGRERFHDVTASVETEIPETATRVFVVYRANTAFSTRHPDGQGLASGFSGRFAMRVQQTLPFSPIEGSDWEVLVDLRSLFREPVAGASVYDELLVVAPPRQIVGGLVVNF